jgi:DNA-binding GntR family transcriptional regulator
MIAQEVLAPGDRLRERELAGRLSVSRTPLREALRILAVEGLVEHSPNRGAEVANPSLEDIHDCLAMLGALEALAGEQAAARATDAEIAEIRALHVEMRAAFERNDRLTYFKRNQQIHHGIVAASKNAALIEVHTRTNAKLYRIRFASHQRHARRTTAVSRHGDILAALSARDGVELARLLREHLEQAWVNITEQANGSTQC